MVTPTTQGSARRGRLIVKVLLSLALSAVFLTLSFWHTDIATVVATIGRAPTRALLGFAGVLLAIHVVRTLRWALLLAPLGRVSLRRVNSATAIGYMLLLLLPLRLGEFARPILVAAPHRPGDQQLSRSGAFASCVVERIMDMIALGVMGIVSLRLLARTGEAAAFAERASLVVTVAFSGACVALVVAAYTQARSVALLTRILSPISARLAERAAGMLDSFISGLTLGSPLRIFAVLGSTAAVWALHVYGFWLLALAFQLQLTLLMVCAVVAVNIVGAMIPAGPGMVGTSQFFTQLGVSIFVAGALSMPGLAARTAAYANTIWALQFVQQVGLGLVFVWLDSVSFTSLFRLSSPQPTASSCLVSTDDT